ncbi:aspartyl protease family protein At5g10770-like [Miscanthus floridulus]|uniref:aspartyl protease family protein At5g10770-like n=1 Tax=Miscanthus floridulus TaxID=154761 RepID=UPI0034587447
MTPTLTLLLLLSLSSPIGHAGGHERVQDKEDTGAEAATRSSIKSKAVCSGHRVSIPVSGRAWLPLNHRHGPCSPLPASARMPSTADVLRRDQLRAKGIRGVLNGSASAVERHPATVRPVTLGSSLDTLEYVITMGLGTPAVKQTVFIDTGSDITWVQCRPCPVPPCHQQKDPMFDPAMSATYSAVPCGSAACRELGRDGGCSSRNLCRYAISYAGNDSSTGTYSSDKLTLSPTYAVDGFLFGCQHAPEETPNDDDARTDGIMGLGGGVPSLVSQTVEKAFSYCLPPSPSYSGFLTLGAPRVSSSRFAVTPMYIYPDHPTFYIVVLQAIVVAGRCLDVPTSVFSNGAIMDSGTPITTLPPEAYRALRAAFRKEMRMYPRAAPMENLDTCFNLDGDVGDAKLPNITLVFERGAAMELDRKGIIVNDGCLAFAPHNDDTSPGIIGNVQQRTFEVLYDIGSQAVGFRRGAC